MHDAIAAETRGIPAVAVMTDRFEQSARAMAAVNGIPDYPFIMLRHPIANDSDADLAAKAETAANQIVELLTKRVGA